MKDGRSPRGRFAPGNPGGPGRPPRQTEANYLRVLMDACPPDTWREVCERAVRDAKAGDQAARSWLARFLLGEPKATAPTCVEVHVQELTGQDPVVDEIARREASAAMFRGLDDDGEFARRVEQELAALDGPGR